jgi:hypothetical protein
MDTTAFGRRRRHLCFFFHTFYLTVSGGKSKTAQKALLNLSLSLIIIMSKNKRASIALE